MNNENINKLVEETLDSLDGAGRATPKSFLFTRITGRMQKTEDSAWDNALRFLSRPAVAMACVILVLVINAVVFTMHKQDITTVVTEDQYAAIDDYNSSVSLLKDLENIEP
jgi:hypothetical protein